jgi:REP element-mobilizing transposase RayT
MTIRRSAQISLSETPYYHCIARCVRRAFLCGEDQYTGQDFNHRRGWLVKRLKRQAAVFGIDICAYAIMSNHYHVVLRVDRARVQHWSDDEVIERWTRLFHGPLLVQQQQAGEPLSAAQAATVAEIAAVWRARLYDISWFMRCLNEHIARRANAEDDCTGRFWEGRFKSKALLDEAAVVSCMAYVDLNPIRAGMADTLQDSRFTSVQERLKAKARSEIAPSGTTPGDSLSPFSDGSESANSDDKLPIRLDDYLALVTATGRCVRHGQRGAMSRDAAPALDRLSMNSEQWLELVCNIQASSLQAIGALGHMRRYAEASGRCWIKGSSKLGNFYKAWRVAALAI